MFITERKYVILKKAGKAKVKVPIHLKTGKTIMSYRYKGRTLEEPKSVKPEITQLDELSKVEADQLNRIVKKWKGGERKEVGGQAVADMLDGAKGITAKKEGRTVGIASYDLGTEMVIWHMATGEKGTGHHMMQELAKVADEKGIGMKFVSDMGAVGFYEKLGITVGENNVCKVSREEVQGLAKNASLSVKS